MRITWTGAATAAALSAIILSGIRSTALAGPEGKPSGTKAAVVAPIVWTDVNGNGYGPTQIHASAATVFIFVSTECPLASAYAPRIRELQTAYFAKRVPFYLVDSHLPDTADAVKEWAKQRDLSVPLVKDVGTALADRLGATRTPEAVIVDRTGAVVYRGRIDDSTDPKLVRREHLHEALDAVLTGKPVPQPKVGVVDGCLIPRPDAIKSSAKPTVTYAKDVAPLLNANCVSCHRKGEVAPFALETYEQAKLWAPMLADVSARRIMPPWKATPGFGDFHNVRALSEKEVATLKTWAATGAPSGDLKTAPKTPTFPAEWPAGKPDVILKAERPYQVAGEGSDVYRCFVLPAEFKQDVYVTQSQVKPDNRGVVHHVIVYVDPTGKKCLEADAKDPGDGFTNPHAGAGAPVDGAYPVAAWAPGNQPVASPGDIGVPIPKGARLIMEVHYHRSGQAEMDQTAVGLTFSRETIHKIPDLRVVVSPSLNLEPGNPDIHVKGRMTLYEDVTVGVVAPHMHQIGKDMHVWATKPDGSKEELIYLKNWDFNWQTSYLYREPVKLPKGTVVEMEAVFDNSAQNPRNPNRPPKKITWGEASTDEMCIAFLGCLKDGEQLNIQPAPWQDSVVLLPDGAIRTMVSALTQTAAKQ